MYAGKPIIGIAGGIGSGKSFVASLFGELGCMVITSDDQAAAAYRDDEVKRTLRRWWGDAVLKPSGEVDKFFIASKVFNDESERRRLEGLIHPRVHEMRQREMAKAASDPSVRAFIWDTPLLFETSLNDQCDAVVFVDAPLPLRLQRVSQKRAWDEAELLRREKSQHPLDRKREISDYVVSNTADADFARGQVQDVLSRILAKMQ